MKTLFLLYYFVFQLIQRNKGDDNYLGCYIDQVGTRDLDTFIGDELSPTQCITACREQNFTYAGIQFGNECRCGQTYGLYGEVSDGECDYQCTSEEITAKCGGDNRNSVYNVEITTPSDPESDNDCLNNIVGYQGCFEENALEGMLGVVNNIGACITMCSDSIYAGILNGSLCYCGMNIRQSTNLDENECRIPCPTHETTCCGGISLFSIYDVNTYNNATANDSPVLARETDNVSSSTGISHTDTSIISITNINLSSSTSDQSTVSNNISSVTVITSTLASTYITTSSNTSYLTPSSLYTPEITAMNNSSSINVAQTTTVTTVFTASSPHDTSSTLFPSNSSTSLPIFSSQSSLESVRISSYDSSTVILSTSQSSSIIPSSDFNNQNNLSSTNLNTPISASVNPTSISNVINLSSTTATPFIQSYDSSVHSIIATDITPSQHSLAIFDTFSTSLGSAPSTLLSSQNFVGASQFLVSEISLQSTTYSEPTVYQTSITQFSSTIASSTQYSIISTQSSSSQLSGNSETSLHSSTPNQYSTLTFTASSQFFSSEQSSYLGSLLYSTELTPSSTNYLTSLQSIISQSSLMTAASQSSPIAFSSDTSSTASLSDTFSTIPNTFPSNLPSSQSPLFSDVTTSQTNSSFTSTFHSSDTSSSVNTVSFTSMNITQTSSGIFQDSSTFLYIPSVSMSGVYSDTTSGSQDHSASVLSSTFQTFTATEVSVTSNSPFSMNFSEFSTEYISRSGESSPHSESSAYLTEQSSIIASGSTGTTLTTSIHPTESSSLQTSVTSPFSSFTDTSSFYSTHFDSVFLTTGPTVQISPQTDTTFYSSPFLNASLFYSTHNELSSISADTTSVTPLYSTSSVISADTITSVSPLYSIYSSSSYSSPSVVTDTIANTVSSSTPFIITQINNETQSSQQFSTISEISSTPLTSIVSASVTPLYSTSPVISVGTITSVTSLYSTSSVVSVSTITSVTPLYSIYSSSSYSSPSMVTDTITNTVSPSTPFIITQINNETQSSQQFSTISEISSTPLTSIVSAIIQSTSHTEPTISLNQLTESSSLAFTTILSTTNTITLASSSISHEATTFVSSSTLMFDSTIITTSPTITSQAVNTEITASNTYVTSSEQSTSYVSTTTMINSLLSSTSYSSDFTSSTILLSVPSIFPVTSTLSTQTTTLSSQGIVGSTEYITNFTQTSTITTGILNFTQTSTLTSESTTLVPESDIVYSGFNGTFNAKNDTQRTKLNDGLTAIVYLAFCLNNPCNSGRRKRQTNCLLEAVIVNITQPNATADPNYYRVYYYVKNCTTISGLLVYNAISSLPVSLMQAQLTISIPGINLIAAERVQLVVAENTTTSTTSTAPVDKKLWLIGAVLGPIAFVLLLILVFLYLHYKCRPRVKNNMSSAQALSNAPETSRTFPLLNPTIGTNYNAIQGRQPTTGVDSLIQSNPLDQNERQRISPPSTKPYDGRVTNVPQFPIPSDIPLHIRESIRSKSDVERWRNKIRMQEKFEKIYQSPLTDLDRLKDVTSSTTVPPLSRPTPRMRTYQYDNPAYNNNQEDLVQMPVRNDEQEYYEKSYAIHSPRRIPRQSEVEVGRTKLHRLLDEVLDKAGDEQLNPDSKSETLKRRRQRRRTRPQENYYGGDSSDPIIEDHEQRRHIPVIAQVTDRPDPNITRLRYNPYEAGDRAAEISRSIPVELHRKYASNNEDVSASPNQTKYSQQTNNTLFNNHTNNLPDRSATSTDAFASAKRVPRTRIETDQEVLMRQNDMRNISDTTRERPRTAVPEDNRRQHMFNSDGVYVDSIKTRFPTNEDDISRKHVSRAWNEDQQQVQRMPLQRPEPSRTDPDARFHLNSYEAGFSNQQPRRNDYKDEYLMAKQSVVSTKNFISSIQGELQSIVGIPPGTDHV